MLRPHSTHEGRPGWTNCGTRTNCGTSMRNSFLGLYEFLLVVVKYSVGGAFLFDTAFVIFHLTTSLAIQTEILYVYDDGSRANNDNHRYHNHHHLHFDLEMMQNDDAAANIARNRSSCPIPCRCPRPEEKLQCKGGVSIIRDGCDCCFICARQQGDLCDFRHRCDEEKAQFCDFTLDDGLRGICRAQSGRPCDVQGKIYQDGEHFQLNCSQLCTCQNGQYACASLCPQEERAPSRGYCKDLQLISIGGRCCKEWVCPHSHSLPQPEDDLQKLRIAPKRDRCSKETTGWSQCSVTCGSGWSVRLTNENEDCLSVQERRLCIVRPCHLNDKHLQGRMCKTTWKENLPMRIAYDACVSVKEYRPKYCSTCKKNRCCRPELTKTLFLQMTCTTDSSSSSSSSNNNNNNNNNNNRTVVEKLMWIKSCRCKESYCKK